MNDADQIRRCNGALCANLSLLQIQNPEFSNREALRLEINVTQTKQTTQPHSNREAEALFSNRVRAVDRLRDCQAIDSARRYIARAVNRLRDCSGIEPARRNIHQPAKTNPPEPGIRNTRRSSITEFNKQSRTRCQNVPSKNVSVRKNLPGVFNNLRKF